MINESGKANQFQQGDVQIRSVDALPPGVVENPTSHRVVQGGKSVLVKLAEGEHTGHFHGFQSDGAHITVFEDPNNKTALGEPRRYVKLEKPDVLTHQEHAPITLDPGVYEFAPVIEYDPLEKMSRAVQD